MVLAGQVAYAWRWRLLLQAAGVQVPFRHVVRQYFVGIFVNNFLPSTVGGDVAKVYYLGDRYGYRTVTASVAIDRALGVGVLAALAASALADQSGRSGASDGGAARVRGGCGARVGFLVLTRVGTGGLAARVTWLGNRAVGVAERLQRLRLDMAAPLGRPAIILQAAAVVVGYAVAMTAVYQRFVVVAERRGTAVHRDVCRGHGDNRPQQHSGVAERAGIA